ARRFMRFCLLCPNAQDAIAVMSIDTVGFREHFVKELGQRKMVVKAVLTLAIVGGVVAIPVLAHHSFAAEFDAANAVRLVGTLTRIEWTNSHSYFYVDVKDDKGAVANWAWEGAAPGVFSRRGFKKSDIRLGDTLSSTDTAPKTAPV